jgi:hypothetical protein
MLKIKLITLSIFCQLRFFFNLIFTKAIKMGNLKRYHLTMGFPVEQTCRMIAVFNFKRVNIDQKHNFLIISKKVFEK